MDSSLDKTAVRASFDAAAASYDAFATLQRTVGERLLEHLDVMRLDPRLIIDVGAGTGYCAKLLARRYRRATLVLCDIATAMLRRARAGSSWRYRPRYCCGDMEAMPIASGVADMVFSNLALQWSADLAATLAECRRLLQSRGLLLFSSLGPNTLIELRSAWAAVDEQPHVNHFLDIQAVGNALIQAGFAGPVLESERITLRYAKLPDLLRDLKGIGARNALTNRARGMLSRRRWETLEEAYEAYRADDLLPASYEVLYGHAWAPTANTRRQDGSTVATFPLRNLGAR